MKVFNLYVMRWNDMPPPPTPPPPQKKNNSCKNLHWALFCREHKPKQVPPTLIVVEKQNAEKN